MKVPDKIIKKRQERNEKLASGEYISKEEFSKITGLSPYKITMALKKHNLQAPQFFYGACGKRWYRRNEVMEFVRILGTFGKINYEPAKSWFDQPETLYFNSIAQRFIRGHFVPQCCESL